jgi:hypothetical protein
VYRASGHFGSVVLRVGQRELGHLHGDAVADVPLPPKLQAQLLKDGAAPEHLLRHDSGWVTVPLDTEEGVQQALVLLRSNYDRAQGKRSLRRLKAPSNQQGRDHDPFGRCVRNTGSRRNL